MFMYTNDIFLILLKKMFEDFEDRNSILEMKRGGWTSTFFDQSIHLNGDI